MSKLLLHDNRERLVYVALWAVLFLAPVLSMHLRVDGHPEAALAWGGVARVWKVLLLYLVAFLVHDTLLAPLLIRRGRCGLWLLGTACLVAAVVAVSHATRASGAAAVASGGGVVAAPETVFVGHVDLVNAFVLSLLIGLDVGVKLYFKAEADQTAMERLERQRLQWQLACLRHQVNPHFFMNTLNNIHALVDTDPALAKDTIVRFSRLMRFVLYESDRPVVPLAREVGFIRLYVGLMRMRFADGVTIDDGIPDQLPDCEVPPLVLVTFVENAFKHGVSYRRESHVGFSIAVDGGRCRFVCRNSKQPQAGAETRSGGIGLANVRQRLDLLYGDAYRLIIQEGAACYRVELSLPLRPPHLPSPAAATHHPSITIKPS